MATTVTWNGSTAFFNTAADWSGNVVPSAANGDVGQINAGTVEASGTLDGFGLALGDATRATVPALALTNVDLGPNLTVQDIAGSGGFSVSVAGTLTNDGTVALSSATDTTTIANGPSTIVSSADVVSPADIASTTANQTLTATPTTISFGGGAATFSFSSFDTGSGPGAQVATGGSGAVTSFGGGIADFNAGASIDQSGELYTFASQSTASGIPNSVADDFIGLSFTLSDGVHYGYAEVNGATLVGYAYDTKPAATISTGSTAAVQPLTATPITISFGNGAATFSFSSFDTGSGPGAQVATGGNGAITSFGGGIADFNAGASIDQTGELYGFSSFATATGIPNSVADDFIGLSFTLPDGLHYGYAEVNGASLVGYGYNAEPATTVATGATSSPQALSATPLTISFGGGAATFSFSSFDTGSGPGAQVATGGTGAVSSLGGGIADFNAGASIDQNGELYGFTSFTTATAIPNSVADDFIGLSFTLSDGVHYGYAEVNGGTLVSYGYNATAATTITAGATLATPTSDSFVNAADGRIAVTSSSLNIDTTSAQNNGTIAVSSGGTLNIDHLNTDTVVFGGSGTVSIASGGAVADAAAATGAGEVFAFRDGTADALTIRHSAGFAATIGGFQRGNRIDVTDVAADTATWAGNVLSLRTGGAAGAVLATLSVVGGYAGSTFAAASDGAGGTLVTVACFAAGTRIATTRGEVAVERLREGDAVLTRLGGATAPVRWVGTRRVNVARHPHSEQVRPVRVRAGALGPNMPTRDVLLSPEHALHVDGVLVPVGLLVNGTSIVPHAVDAITYYHVELSRHDVLLAEGLPAESWLDTGNRAIFANAPVTSLTPADFAPDARSAAWAEQACAELVTAGRRLAAIRAGIAARVADVGAGEVRRAG